MEATDSVSLAHRLENVEVTARRRQAEVIPSQRLDGEQLRGLNSQSVADALRYFAGVQIKDYGGVGGIKTVNI
ncbi:MAG: TonB-dependent receptor, partial [Muribaculaceae bacterium]|nr:TonB-dependent receptor [Muribaculaceae bacterium]